MSNCRRCSVSYHRTDGSDSRTVLVEHKNGTNPADVSYLVVANRLPNYDGFSSYYIKARLMSDHFLLTITDVARELFNEPFGIVDADQPDVALDRMYQEAKRLAEKRAAKDHNHLIDLTSRAEKLTSDDLIYALGKKE